MCNDNDEFRKCQLCGRYIPLSDLGADVVGRPILSWHYAVDSDAACPGSLLAMYDATYVAEGK